MTIHKRFIEWYLSQLCHHQPEWIMVSGKVMRCSHCQKDMPITDDLVARYNQSLELQKVIL